MVNPFRTEVQLYSCSIECRKGIRLGNEKRCDAYSDSAGASLTFGLFSAMKEDRG